MKNFRKNESDLFVCELCEKAYQKKENLSRHISLCHNISKKEYYDKFIKEENEEICPICKNINLYSNRWDRGYKSTCSKKHENELRYMKIKEFRLKNHGNENYNNSEKRNLTNTEKYGNKCPMQNINIHEIIKNNNIKNYGVEWPFQSDEIQQKVLKTFSQYKFYKNTSVFYQTTYELDFIEKYIKTIANLQRGPTIKYKYKNKLTYYMPDFYLPSLNLIVEIKNSYLAKRDKNKIRAKKKATIANGFKYIMIIDKNYNHFEKLLKTSV